MAYATKLVYWFTSTLTIRTYVIRLCGLIHHSGMNCVCCHPKHWYPIITVFSLPRWGYAFFGNFGHGITNSFKFQHLNFHDAAYVRQWIRSALFQILACRLFGAKPLSEPMLGYCEVCPYEQTSVKLESKYKTIHSWKCILRCRLRNGGHFVQGRWVKLGRLRNQLSTKANKNNYIYADSEHGF